MTLAVDPLGSCLHARVIYDPDPGSSRAFLCFRSTECNCSWMELTPSESHSTLFNFACFRRDLFFQTRLYAMNLLKGRISIFECSTYIQGCISCALPCQTKVQRDTWNSYMRPFHSLKHFRVVSSVRDFFPWSVDKFVFPIVAVVICLISRFIGGTCFNMQAATRILLTAICKWVFRRLHVRQRARRVAGSRQLDGGAPRRPARRRPGRRCRTHHRRHAQSCITQWVHFISSLCFAKKFSSWLASSDYVRVTHAKQQQNAQYCLAGIWGFLINSPCNYLRGVPRKFVSLSWLRAIVCAVNLM